MADFDFEYRPTLIQNARLIEPLTGVDRVATLLVSREGVEIDPESIPLGALTMDGAGLWATPAFIDLQVHFRQPGFEYKETIETGSRAALAGGITSVVVMPNTNPALDTPESVRFEHEEAERVGGINLYVAGAATRGLDGKILTDHKALKEAGAVAITDDGLPVMDETLMTQSLIQCKANDLLFMQHAEDLRISQHAPMTLSPMSEALGVRGQPADAEGVLVERDIALVERVGARYHVLHTSTARSLKAITRAKQRGLPVTCEASPHHLLLTYAACAGHNTLAKMNPPLRSEIDRQALVAALLNGVVDAVATDHAPHSDAEKAKSFEEAPFGVIGLETAFPALLSFVHKGLMTPLQAVALMTSRPAAVLRRGGAMGTLHSGRTRNHLTLVDPNHRWEVSRGDLHGRSKNSAFLGMPFIGKVAATFMGGRLRFLDGFAASRLG